MSPHLEQVDSSVQSTGLPGLSVQDINATERTQSARAHHDDDATPTTASSPILHSRDYVSRLPPELLCAIFVASALQWRVEWWSNKRSRSVVPPSVVVSHVCSFWRRVALNCSSLWSFLFLRSVETMKTFLARSTVSPLHILYDDRYGKDSCEALLSALEHMDRIRGLTLKCGWTTGTNKIAIWKKLAAPAPVLHSLRLEAFDFPTKLFNDMAPSLCRMYLRGNPEGLTSPIFSARLTHLTMIACHLIDVDEFFLALKRMHNLQQLSWRCYTEITTQSGDQVRLPCLRKLTLYHVDSAVTMFPNRLIFPSNAVVKLKLAAELQGEYEDHLHTFIKDRFNGNPGMPQDDMTLRTLSIERLERVTNIYCSSNVGANETDSHPLDDSRQLYITFHNSGTERRHNGHFGSPLWRPDVSKFCATLPVSHLGKLTMSNDSCHKGCCPWPVSNPPQLHTIIIDSGRPSNMIHALLPDDVTTPIFAPGLTEIWLRHVKFSQNNNQAEEYSGGASSRKPRYSSVMCFYNMLAKRAKHDAKLQRLQLEMCPGIGEADVTMLGQVVDAVEVDYHKSTEI